MRRLTKILAIVPFAIAALIFWGGPASAQEAPVPAPDAYVGGVTTIPTSPSDTPAADPEVLGATASNSTGSATPQVQGSSLAFTGGDILAISLMGAVAFGGGVFLLVMRRRGAVPS